MDRAVVIPEFEKTHPGVKALFQPSGVDGVWAGDIKPLSEVGGDRRATGGVVADPAGRAGLGDPQTPAWAVPLRALIYRDDELLTTSRHT
ncbi:hypothetical protein [Nonomuraea sp. NPDC049400]|uniref:hypothetical protein n=1 Tax=Nonomuraea sp. NPDC049400 TaxID=3364352 RepID=UPI0037AE7C36